MKSHALATPLCLAELAEACSTVGGSKEPRLATGFTRDGALASMLNADLSVAKVDRASDRAVGHAGRARAAHADPAIDLSGAGTFRNQAKISGDFA
ncbi:MAG: hypothetical protein H7306_03995 [Bacteriovorax sp.]|nr:hypothetical protein [Rhizobacter sp.]